MEKLDDDSNVAKLLRDLLVKAGVDCEFDLTNPEIMETIRDVLIND